MSRHAVITGATGFLGSAITSELLNNGFSVSVLLRGESVETRLAALSGHNTLRYSRLSDPDLRAELALQQPDVFVHCGWRGVAGYERNEGYQFSENIPATIDSVNLAAAIGCRHWIGLGSQAEYGNQNQCLNETADTRPTTMYGKAKLAAGIVATGLCDAHGITGTWLRVFSTYGPGDSPSWFLPYVTQEFIAGREPKLTKCEQIWDYLYVDDFAKAVVAVIKGEAAGIYNAGSGNAVPLRQYIEMIRTELGVALNAEYGAIPYRADQVMHLQADISKLAAATGWKPQKTLSAGIREMVAFELGRAAVRSSN
jgi:UDP-glucose 4-epimerase